MKRKVIQLANSTAVISLPSKWVKKWGVKKGDEIEVGEEENRLVVQVDQANTQKQEIICNLCGMAPRALMWTLTGVYKAGYDRIRFLYDESIQLENIHKIVSSLLDGFQIIQEGEGYCVVESVFTEQQQDFLPIFRKALHIISMIGKSSSECLKKGQLDQLKEVLALEETNNQLSNLCERLVNKNALIPQGVRSHFFVMAWHSQKICNYYRDICRYVLEKQKLKLSKKLLEVYEATNQVIQAYDEVYIRLDVPRMVELYVESRKKIASIDASQFSKDEQPILFNLLFILNRVSDISTMLIGVHEAMRQGKT